MQRTRAGCPSHATTMLFEGQVRRQYLGRLTHAFGVSTRRDTKGILRLGSLSHADMFRRAEPGNGLGTLEVNHFAGLGRLVDAEDDLNGATGLAPR